ncbi:sensor histidine kinase [Dyella nitratireducens]|uniref:ATPase n=1 Tax=Dyella nitratireducens TaxID=1849580 RepID=A0ABQ1FPH7_9GAMM|nr:histidine kinase [Dyella nitratireducens]GGA24707.1 ATPase [Dyella nitratireducens]GLQ43788.1 ATPase [Dyella nitratireducens]
MNESTRTHKLKTFGLAFGFWTMLALSYAASSVLGGISEGHPVPWFRALSWNLIDFYLWMALTPVVSWLGRVGAHGWRRFWMLHIPSSILLAVLQSAVMLLLFFWWCGPNPKGNVLKLTDLLRNEGVYKFHLALLTYWMMLVVLRGFASWRLLRDERYRSAQLETQLAQSQLQALRMQLQPHFLFNTLNAISALTVADPQQAKLMIARLSDFLRLTLEERHAQQVPLSREMQFLESYLGIQKVRFQDRLVTHVDVGDTGRAMVPSLILQPLVENALRHGLLAKSDGGALHIMARRIEGELHLCVEDDGLGLPSAGAVEGVGLSNTRARLQAMFGDKASMDLSSGVNGGTRVALRFPFVEAGA